MFYGTIVSDKFLEETKLKLFDNIAGFNAIAGAVLSVSEYKKPIDEAKAAGYQACLVGTALMKDGHPGEALASLLTQSRAAL